jgi:hypothetical protein
VDCLIIVLMSSGMNQLLWYYADLEKDKCYHLSNPNLPDFDEQEKPCTIWRRFSKLDYINLFNLYVFFFVLLVKILQLI